MQIDDLSFYETAGFSMWPFIRQQEKLIIKKLPIEDLRIGDIILYQANSQMVCHRLIRKVRNRENYLLYARGDNSSNLEPVTEEMFLGKAIGVIKNRKTVNLCTKRQKFVNRFIVIIAPLLSWAVRVGKKLLRKK